MSARTCLLCGKALSRIWVGAGEDFCSREHRNQYRLRRGMDRLQEANKVATLMRRREQPKPIAAILQPGNRAARVPDSSSIVLPAQGMKPIYPSSSWAPPSRVPGARGAVEWKMSPLAEGKSRDYGILRQFTSRVILGKGLRKVESPGANYLEKTRQPRQIRLSGRHGSALRVSAGAGFRLPAKRGRHLPTPRHTQAGMRWPELPIEQAPQPRDRRTYYTISRKSMPAPEPVNPASPEPHQRSAMAWPQAITPARRNPTDGPDVEKRQSDTHWSEMPASMPRAINPGKVEMAGAELVPVLQRPAFGSPVKQVGVVPWTQQDSPLGYSPAKSNSGGANPSATGSFEEHFDAGFRDWTGGVDDWIIDAAGVRTGRLALFSPSLEMRDYDVEFLARIENQSVTWVFRASTLREYYIASIGMAPGGGYEFWRGSLIGGVSEPDAAIALLNAPNPKTAVTVRLRAEGSEFAVWVDGQSIDSWTDNRLPGGGIGFMGASDDRARIYWVKLSAVGATCKE
ncbi:MAG TPA: hypothetical protein VGH38_25585 [Bryobacteraceae bacterium]